MLAEGLGLMAAGMGMVFAFLVLLVLVMMASTRLFSHFPDSPDKDITRPDAGTGNGSHRKIDLKEVAAAIAAAKARMQD
ncbi:MAG: OadG family protein [Bacteroidales bacterium]|nr:OadG family protein [Candidatus Latescibacterota bacterium]